MLRLARAGRSVVLIEEGPSRVDPGFGWTDVDISRDLLRQGGRVPTTDGSVSIVQGRCLGGSATVSAGIAAAANPRALEQWQSQGWSADTIRRFGAACDERLEALGATLDGEQARPPADSVLARGAVAIRHDGRWLERVAVRTPGGALAGPMVSALEEARSKFGARSSTTPAWRRSSSRKVARPRPGAPAWASWRSATSSAPARSTPPRSCSARAWAAAASAAG
ncbi:MAG: hypothetical protein GY898_27785 [Proteobacteria bacterium]|nr:hypothetical protein [Pseudomonadota bacterium]